MYMYIYVCVFIYMYNENTGFFHDVAQRLSEGYSYMQPVAFELSFFFSQISVSNLNLVGLCSTERGKRDLIR